MNAKAVKPIPEGMRSVTPHLICAGAAQAIEFYRRAFGAEDISRQPGPDGRLMHAALRIGDSVIFLTDEFPEQNCLGPSPSRSSPVAIHLYVTDADEVFARAQAAGATVIMPVADRFWGDRYGLLRDPYGHRWSIATHQRDVTPEEMREAVRRMSSGCPQRPRQS